MLVTPGAATSTHLGTGGSVRLRSHSSSALMISSTLDEAAAPREEGGAQGDERGCAVGARALGDPGRPGPAAAGGALLPPPEPPSSSVEAAASAAAIALLAISSAERDAGESGRSPAAPGEAPAPPPARRASSAAMTPGEERAPLGLVGAAGGAAAAPAAAVAAGAGGESGAATPGMLVLIVWRACFAISATRSISSLTRAASSFRPCSSSARLQGRDAGAGVIGGQRNYT